MDTRRVAGSRESFGPAAELGPETVPSSLVQLAEVRAIVSLRGPQGFWTLISNFALIGILAVIAILAIATSAGWSILDAY